MSAKRILMPLPDRDFDTTEVAVPWKLLTERGHQVVFATEGGGQAPACDPLLLSGVVFGKLGAAPEPRAFYAELEQAPAFNTPLSWRTLEVSDFEALLLPGGHAPGMCQYLGSAALQRQIVAFWKTGRPVGAICHGVLPLARAIDTDTGQSVLHGRRTTCLTRPLERTAFLLTFWKLGRYYRTYPAYVEDEVRAALADPTHFVRGPKLRAARGTRDDDGPAFVVEDGRYVSARWPGDAYLFAKKMIERLA